jgi:hypothetical protein
MQGFLSVRVIPNRRGTIWLKQIGLLGKGYLSKILTLVSSYTVEKFPRSNCGQMTVITRTNLSHLPVRLILITDAISSGVLAILATLMQSRKSFLFNFSITCSAISVASSPEIPSSVVSLRTAISIKC